MYHLGLSKEMVKRHTNRFWCSALVAFIYTELGLIDSNTDWSNMAPSDLANNKFEVFKPSVLRSVETIFNFK